MRTLFLFFSLVLIAYSGYTQNAAAYSVQLSAQITMNPHSITLNWVGNPNTQNWIVYRKLTTETGWGTAMSTLSGAVLTYTDSTVEEGVSYEYKVEKSTNSYTGYGYINAGINLSLVDYRGRLLLIVDSTIISGLTAELEEMIKDMEGDGWEVVRMDIDRVSSVNEVRNLIIAEYDKDEENTNAVFLFGHVPVPYSGNIVPDGHTNNHWGAWPADGVYGDVDGLWTDNSISNTSAAGVRNDNVPFDGKFDQSTFPSEIELQVGRVDFANMPQFSETEEELLKAYLIKNHDYKHKTINPVRRALIDDNFGGFGGEAFAANGWRNFSVMVGSDSIVAADYFGTMANESYLWSYGCGGGSFTSCSGVGTTSNFASTHLQSVFTALFGSYFGDWDSDNNLLRAALANGNTLTNAWAGRPNWQFHHMAMGENIGYSARLAQNNSTVYYPNNNELSIHIALMGDPTLRMHVVEPPSSVSASLSSDEVDVSWVASNDNVIGYHIYRKAEWESRFKRISNDVVAGLQYTDGEASCAGEYTYMVKAIKLEESLSGTYTNSSQGICADVTITEDQEAVAAFSFVQTSPSVFEIEFTNTSSHADSWEWNFGDGSTSTEENPTYAYNWTADGYIVELIASSHCDADTITEVIKMTGIDEAGIVDGVEVFPNPAHKEFTLSIDSEYEAFYTISILTIEGKVVLTENWSVQAGENQKRFEIDLSNGMYMILLDTEGTKTVKQLVIK